MRRSYHKVKTTRCVSLRYIDRFILIPKLSKAIMSCSHIGELSSVEPSIKAVDVEKSQAYHGEITGVEDLEDREKGHGFVRDPSDVNSHQKSGLEASLVRKVDAAILPLAALIFLVAYMVCITSLKRWVLISRSCLIQS